MSAPRIFCRGDWRTAASLACGLLALLLALVQPPLAEAAPVWRVKSTHGPTNFPPGGTGQFTILARNAGDEATHSTAITAVDRLPAGVSAIAAGGKGWDCSGTGFPTAPGGLVTCTSATVVKPPQPPGVNPDPTVRGMMAALRITVAIGAGATGSGENRVTILGGGATKSAFDVDPTVFDSEPAGFGIVPGTFVSDFFAAPAPVAEVERQAGSHPFELRVDFDLTQRLVQDSLGTYTLPTEEPRSVRVKMPPGFLGNPQATPRCTPERLLYPIGGFNNSGSCPTGSQVGSVDLVLSSVSKIVEEDVADPTQDVPVYNMEPPRGKVAAFAFSFTGRPVWIIASLDPTDYSVVTTLSDVNQTYALRESQLTLWGVPAESAHDALRYDTNTGNSYGAPAGAERKPFLTLPGQCDTPTATGIRMDSWQNPGEYFETESAPVQLTGCERQRFNPRITVQPSSSRAASPTGLDVELTVPQGENPAAVATAHLRDAVTRLPAGMAVNPSAADGLVGCSQADVGLGTNADPSCPDNSKIGTVEIDSPLVPDTLRGHIYQARQNQNPHGSMLGFYTVAQGNGLTIKLASKVEADPQTGNLTTTFLDNPQLPFSSYRLHFWGGQRAPLVNPPTCGTYVASGHFTSWNSSMPTVVSKDSVAITEGPGGASCANSLAERPFSPSLDAKSLLPIAGAFSDFALEVGRADGTQELSSIETALPPGVLAKLADVPFCGDATLAAISAAPGSGAAEKASPSCPSASLVGHSDVAAGAGSLPFHSPGTVYLTGPYKGAPLGLAVVTPVVAGPLDLGSIVVRAALHVDPITAQVRVVSDPLPSIIEGIPLNLRAVRVVMDRPQFTLNPTSCEEMATTATIGSLQGARAAVSERYQVGACAALGFRPSLRLKLNGGTRRGSFPRLRAELRMPGGNANVSRAAVTLPRSVILEQAHIRTVCTRVQFAAGACPPSSVYGHARAFSPLLDRSLEGPVYLRSNGGERELPDLVAALDGQIEIELEGHIDAVRERLRTRFASVPDAPISKFVLEMKGGKRGLLAVSRNLCAATDRTIVKMGAHNGRLRDSRPIVHDSCGKRKGATR